MRYYKNSFFDTNHDKDKFVCESFSNFLYRMYLTGGLYNASVFGNFWTGVVTVTTDRLQECGDAITQNNLKP